MLLMHNLNIHRKTGATRRKISSFLSNLLENELLYSSDSECEYRITTTVRRIAKIKPEIKAPNDSDDDTRSINRITRSGSIATIKRESSEVDRGVGGVNFEISCRLCGLIVDTEPILKEHIQNEHDGANVNDNGTNFLSEFGKDTDDSPSSENDSSLQYEPPSNRVRSKTFSCDVCSKLFKRKVALVKHMKQHGSIEDMDDDTKNDIADDISDNYDTDDSDIMDSKTAATSGFPCNLCGKIYETKDHILKHFQMLHSHDEDALSVIIDVINKHEGVGFPCTSCAAVYSNRDSLHRHLRRMHQIRNKDNDKSNQGSTCEVCGKVFYRPKCFATHLKKHKETIVEKRRTKSPKKKTHLCSFCGKSYPGSNHLKIHLRIHTGERPFKCQFCDKTFAIKKTWQDHTYSHTGEKPYACPVENCGKRFTHSTGVRQHMQCCHSSEKQFQCPHCDKKCSKKTHLEDHIRSHTGERPYECKYCGIKFRLTSTLRIHHRTHTGERPFVCTICNRGFIKSYGLKQHMKSKRNCLPTSAPPTLSSEIEPQQQPMDNISTEDVQFHQLLILPPHQVLS